MRIVCPSCDAVYQVPDAMLAAGARAVRCAKCGQEWTPAPAEPVSHDDPPPQPSAEPPPSAPVIQPLPEPPTRAESRLSSYRARTGTRVLVDDAIDERLPPRDYETIRGGRGAWIGWVLSVLLLVGLAVAAVAWRGPIMAAWPPSERLYGILGLR